MSNGSALRHRRAPSLGVYGAADPNMRIIGNCAPDRRSDSLPLGRKETHNGMSHAVRAMDTQGLDPPAAPELRSGRADGACGTEFRTSDGHGLRGLPYGVPGAHSFRARIQGQCLYARQSQAGARHRRHQAGDVVLGHAAAAGGNGASVADLAQFAAAGRYRRPRALADQHGRLSAAVQSVLRRQGGAARRGFHSADVWE